MKHRLLLCALLAAEALACAASCFAPVSAGSWALTVISLPSYFFGRGLRALSLSGAAGNAAAWALYLAAGALPAGVLAMLWRKKRLCPEDGLLVVLSAVLLAVLYEAVNPGSFPLGALSVPLDMEIALTCLNVLFWSILLTWAVLRWVRALQVTARLENQLRLLLAVLAAAFVASVFGPELSDTLSAIRSLTASNTGVAVGELHLTIGFFWAQWAVDALPCMLNLAVLFYLARLLEAAQQDRYSEFALSAAGELSRWSCISAVASVVLQAGLNLALVACAGRLYHLNVVCSLPLLPLCFALGSLVLARWIAAGKAIKDENDQFI